VAGPSGSLASAPRSPITIAGTAGDRGGRAAPATHERPNGSRSPAPPIAFGPVRSRRLGWSLGINNVLPKTCSYSCVYCQVGHTDRPRLEREAFFEPDDVVAAVRDRLADCRVTGQPVDYATFVPDGEPTLDRHLGETLRRVAALGVKVAVLSNASLLWRDDVRAELGPADWVSLKIDSVDERIWRRLNRPIGRLRLEAVLDGVRRFMAGYRGDLVTETMLVAGLNDDEASIARTAEFLSVLEPLRAYISIPTRPPAEAWVHAPSSDAARRAAEVFREYELPTTCLVEEIETSDEGEGPFAVDGDTAQGLLGILAVHPMTESAARDYLDRSGADWSVARALLDSGQIVAIRHRQRTFLRRSRGHTSPASIERAEGRQPDD
jgi:wyosine [tRNA(Phe)-imidazoG37] synthetase (radical SAM superfamily)